MKKLRLLALLLVATVPFAACGDDEGPTQPETGSFAGTVVVEGQPLLAMTVAISGPESATTATDSNGEYQFQNVEAGSYSVEIDVQGLDIEFDQNPQQVQVSGGGSAEVNFTGVDKGAPEVTEILPAAGNLIVLNPDDDNGDDGADSNNDLWFNATDPDLAPGNPGSGLGAITVEQADGTDETAHLGAGSDTDWVFDFGASGVNVGGDGQYEITANVPDVATVPNESEVVWNLIIDSTDPTTNMTNSPSSSVTTSAAAVTLTIEGDASDANDLSEVFVRVREEVGGGDVAGSCDLNDPLVNDTGAGTQQNAGEDEIDVTANASGFAADVVLENPGAGTTQDVCFFIEAADNARNNQGDPEPNESSLSTATTINWN